MATFGLRGGTYQFIRFVHGVVTVKTVKCGLAALEGKSRERNSPTFIIIIWLTITNLFRLYLKDFFYQLTS